MSNPAGALLGLVTPSLNQLAYLRQCVACVEALRPPVVHFVADGGSTDGTVEFLGQRQTAFSSRPDGGIYPALAAALPQLHTPFVGWLNCDDLMPWWTPQVLAEVLGRHPAADVIYGDALELRDGRVALVVTPPPSLMGAFLRSGGVLPQPAVFIRRSLLTGLGGLNTSYRLMADHELWVRAHAAGARFAKAWEVLAVQRMVDDQLMQRHADLAPQEKERIAQTHGLHSHGMAVPARGRLLQGVLHRLGVASLAVEAAGWPRTRHARLVALDRPNAARMMLAPSAALCYGRPGPGLAALISPRVEHYPVGVGRR